MKLKLLLGGLFIASSSVYANDACTEYFDAMDKFYETLHQEGISQEKTAEYRNDIATSRTHHAGFSESDKQINNEYCQEELKNIESSQSLIKTLFEESK